MPLRASPQTKQTKQTMFCFSASACGRRGGEDRAMPGVDLDEALRAYDALEESMGQARASGAGGAPAGEGGAPAGEGGADGDTPRGRRLFLTPFEEIDARPSEPLRYLVRPHLPAGEATMLYAPPRSFKSYLTMEYVLSVALGKLFLGRYAATQGIVFYFDMENNQDRMKERIRAALARDRIAVSALSGNLLMQDRGNGLPAWRLDPDALDELGAYVEGMAPALVVVDNFRKVLPFGVEENSNAEVNPIVNRLLGACERADAALLLVHHANRGNERFSGAGALEGSVANVMRIARDTETRKGIVTSINMRNSEEFEAFAVEMGPEEALSWCPVPGGSDGDDEYVRVTDCVRHGAKTVEEIASYLGVTRTMADRHVKSLTARGALVEAGKRSNPGTKPSHTYALPYRG